MRGNAKMNELNKQTIELYAKQLRVPSFNRYPDIIKQLNKDQGYDDFLVALMKQELETRQEGNRQRKIKSASFYPKCYGKMSLSRAGITYHYNVLMIINEVTRSQFIYKCFC